MKLGDCFRKKTHTQSRKMFENILNARNEL